VGVEEKGKGGDETDGRVMEGRGKRKTEEGK